jgi:hypothetical protein
LRRARHPFLATPLMKANARHARGAERPRVKIGSGRALDELLPLLAHVRARKGKP